MGFKQRKNIPSSVVGLTQFKADLRCVVCQGSGDHITLKGTAAKFGVSAKTITKLVKSRKIPCTYAVGPMRFPEELLDDWAREPELVTA